jgi:hypothetical protein
MSLPMWPSALKPAKRTSGQADRRSSVEQRTPVAKKPQHLVRRRFLLVSQTECRRSRIPAADLQASLSGINRRSPVSRCGRSGRWLTLRRFGGNSLLEAARDEALHSARELLADAIKASSHPIDGFVIADDSGRELETLSLRDALPKGLC